MSKKTKTQARSIVIANNDITYLWWTYPKKIKDCLGFSIHRIIDGKEEKKGLYATVGFSTEHDERVSPQTTDEWPIQSFNWKDVYAPHNKDIAYRIIPMIMQNKDWKHLKRDDANSITTDTVRRTQNYGDINIIFNRGFLSTQAFARRRKDKQEVKAEDIIKGAKGLISEVGNEWRKRLGGQLLYNIHSFFKQKGKFYCSLYELSDQELIDILLASKGAEIILSSSDSNTQSRKDLHKAMKNGDLKVYDRIMKSTSIGHNKFVVHVDKNGNPKSVLTGSTNWTPTGLCGQTNNLVIVNNTDVAEHYLEYWNKLKEDTVNGKALQAMELRDWCRENGIDFPANNNTDIGVWFSPNTQRLTKPKVITPESVPVDLQEIFNLVENAKQVFYLVFNPGTPSIINTVKDAAIIAKKKGKPIFVRGAVSDAVIAKNVTTNIISKDATLPPDTYKVTGVAAIPGDMSYFEKELLKLGFATIHDKIVVIDPFDANSCVVVTGSHNIGFKASYSNDENMLMIKGNTAIAQAYAAHILDVVNHFKWRYKLQNRVAGKKGEAFKKALETAWNDLEEDDGWMDYYYDKNGDLTKEQLLFS